MRYALSRRQFLKLTSVGAVGLVLPWALEGCGDGEDVPEFFMPDERATLEAVTARILPTDQEPGAREAAVVRYIENLLTAFDRDPPFIYAGGPFSGRLPFPDNETGEPSDDVPDNAFLELLPLSRVREIGWRVRLFGSANVPGGDFNDAALGPTRGLRDVYREGLQGLDATSQQLFTRNFVDLSAEDQEGVLDEADQEFV
ncbi:MAG: gluconate 2-dehydrogenase subunit 3 family protein, partial [Dehalococcoidia bacterium]|nr:gluconate 2-dehydrogenase subunit 3 family protein [Dehalococcoidia bacterium]